MKRAENTQPAPDEGQLLVVAVPTHLLTPLPTNGAGASARRAVFPSQTLLCGSICSAFTLSKHHVNAIK